MNRGWGLLIINQHRKHTEISINFSLRLYILALNHFLREKPWGRGCVGRRGAYPGSYHINLNFINLTYIAKFLKASTFVISANLKISTPFVVSHFLSAKVSSEWRLNLGFGTHKKCSFSLTMGVPSSEVSNTQIRWAFFRDQILCPLNGGVNKIEVSQRRGSTVIFR